MSQTTRIHRERPIITRQIAEIPWSAIMRTQLDARELNRLEAKSVEHAAVPSCGTTEFAHRPMLPLRQFGSAVASRAKIGWL